MAYTLSSALAALPVAMLALAWSRRRRALGLAIATLALAPFFVQNATYPWTKLHAAMLCLAAIALGARAVRRSSGGRLVVAAVLLAGSVLSHYSALPLALVALAGLLLRRASSPRGLGTRPLALASLAFTLTLAPWAGWALTRQGAAATFGANTTVMGYARVGIAQTPRKIAFNLVRTLVPWPLTGAGPLLPPISRYPEPDLSSPVGDVSTRVRLGRLRDAAFFVYQTTLPGALGTGGVLLVLVGLARAVRRPAARPWLWGAALALPLAVATHGMPDAFGVAHVVAQPLVLAGLALVAATLAGGRSGLAAIAVLGALVDVTLGILLHVQIESLAPARDPAGGGWLLPIPIGSAGWRNWRFAREAHVALLGDVVAPAAPLLRVLVLAGAVAWLCVLARHAWRVRRAPRPSDAGRRAALRRH